MLRPQQHQQWQCILQGFTQFFVGNAHLGFHGVTRNAKRFRNFCLRPVVEFAHDEYLAATRRQLADGRSYATLKVVFVLKIGESLRQRRFIELQLLPVAEVFDSVGRRVRNRWRNTDKQACFKAVKR